jgi:peroxin-1
MAVAKKLHLASDIDMEEIAQATDGYTGADLQALVYNANLEVIHADIVTPSTNGASAAQEEPVEYTFLGRSSKTQNRTNAEETAFTRRVRRCLKC